jgi:hypothetical protein
MSEEEGHSPFAVSYWRAVNDLTAIENRKFHTIRAVSR